MRVNVSFHRLLRSGVAISLMLSTTIAKARWILWEGGFRSDTGKAVISVDGNWTADGLPQLYHYWKENFEAAIEWRKGDLMSVASTQQQIVYTLATDADGPIRIDFRLSHIIGYGPLELVETRGDNELASVFIREHSESGNDFDPNRVSYQLELFRNDRAVRLRDHKGGIDYEAAPGMTFSHHPIFPWEDESAASAVTIDGNVARGSPPDGNTMPTYLCCASFGFGIDAPSWDKITLTVRANGAGKIIKKGTQFRILLSGVPLRRSHHSIPATSDPLPPAIVYDTDKPLGFRITGVGADDTQSQVAPRSRLVAEDSIHDQDRVGSSVPIGFRLGPNRIAPAREFLNVVLRSEGWTNVQPTVVLNYNDYSKIRLPELMQSSWSRTPDFDAGARPPGRPLWESSVSLCDKADPSDRGIQIPAGEATFYARHLNQRRAFFGGFERAGQQRPAIWEQRQTLPEEVDDNPGAVEGANDRLIADLVGYRTENGRPLPSLWVRTNDVWRSFYLPVERFTVSGKALDINNERIACGHIDVQIHDRPNRLACAWRLENPELLDLILLPLPSDAVNAAAVAINTLGTIVGYYETADSKSRACLWEATESSFNFVDLETFGVARSINDFGQIVGGSDLKSYLWQCGERYDIAEINGAPNRSRALGITFSAEIILITPEGETSILTSNTQLKL